MLCCHERCLARHIQLYLYSADPVLMFTRQLDARFSPRRLPLLQWLSSLPERIAWYLFAVYSLDCTQHFVCLSAPFRPWLRVI